MMNTHILEGLERISVTKEKATSKEVAKEKKSKKNYIYKQIDPQQLDGCRQTKTSRILRHLREHGSITSLDAIRLYDSTRLAAIIHSLRRQGYLITTENINAIDKYERPIRYARYHLKELCSCQK